MNNLQAAAPAAENAAAQRRAAAPPAASSSSSSTNPQKTASSFISTSLTKEQPPIKKTLSDVLVRAGESFENWKKRIVELDSEEIARRQTDQDANCSRKLAMAQISSWGVAAQCRSAVSSSGGARSFPSPIKNIIAEFLGRQIQSLSAIAADHCTGYEFSADMLTLRRDQDRLRAVNFYLQHVHSQAGQGVHRVPITQELCTKAPKMTSGEPVRLDVVFEVLERKGYTVEKANGDDFDDFEDLREREAFRGALRDPTTCESLPLFVCFSETGANQECFDIAVNGVLRGLEREEERPQRSGMSAGAVNYLDAFHSVIHKTQEKAAVWLLRCFRDNLLAGIPTLEVTQELLDRPDYPRLPSGQLCPLSLPQLRAELHKSCSLHMTVFSKIFTGDVTSATIIQIELSKADDAGVTQQQSLDDLINHAEPIPFTMGLSGER